MFDISMFSLLPVGGAVPADQASTWDEAIPDLGHIRSAL